MESGWPGGVVGPASRVSVSCLAEAGRVLLKVEADGGEGQDAGCCGSGRRRCAGYLVLST